MTELDIFVDKLLKAAQEAGIETAEVYYREGESTSAKAMQGKIETYEVSGSRGLSLRGVVGGRMGYASTEAFDDDAIGQLVQGVLESAELNEAEDQDEIFAGESAYPELEAAESDLGEVSSEDLLRKALAVEKAALSLDSRVTQTEGAQVSRSFDRVLIRNTHGLNLSHEQELAALYVLPIARDGDNTATGFALKFGTEFGRMDPDELARKAVDEAVSQLHAEPAPSGTYRIVMRNDVMVSMLGVFSRIFSAENAQQKLSLLAGREGEMIAAEIVTLMDDPLLKGGMASCPFDDEGSACRTKTVICNGRLETLLHSRKTAKKQGVQTTGNARRGGYSGAVHVSPSNLYLKPGEKTLDELLADLGDGLLITDVSGLHAGANPISGDFSLLSKGFMVRGGKRAEPVERITIAGNFYELLKSIRAIGSDLEFPGGSIGSPSVDVGTLSVSGK